ncbi:MFS transporter small subunit [Streptomyces boncukensis]|uniref:Uncharacterized protein n=1 Tax=Streptomyces boncukensis TaxID=2711219 RepID=A0A6G4WYC0_9ACTN|nr:hypothetical protein [Streptomyces boncukensis]NGO69862.1 hypothetical protein [Streptomyces boncukensis]
MAPRSSTPADARGPRRRTALTVLVWLWVGLPLAYGLYELIDKATQLFTN